MKPLHKILITVICGIFIFINIPEKVSGQPINVSFQVFYDDLSPYGQWIDYPDYGYVWMPDAGPDFIPYSTNGHWILSDYGWTWVSDYNWGWAPFHYGRWFFADQYGWLWEPGNEWGPAWVTWRRADGYYGWEPLRPGVTITASFGSNYDPRYDHWIFVSDRDIDRNNINKYAVKRQDHDRIIKNSTIINKTTVDNSRHTTYISGPPREDVQKTTGKNIKQFTIRGNSKPGQVVSKGQLQIYRPQVNKNNEGGKKPVPSKVVNLNDVKRSSGKSANQPKNKNDVPKKRAQGENPKNKNKENTNVAKPDKTIINNQAEHPANSQQTGNKEIEKSSKKTENPQRLDEQDKKQQNQSNNHPVNQSQKTNQSNNHTEDQAKKANQSNNHTEEQAKKANQLNNHTEEQANKANQSNNHTEEQANKSNHQAGSQAQKTNTLENHKNEPPKQVRNEEEKRKE